MIRNSYFQIFVLYYITAFLVGMVFGLTSADWGLFRGGFRDVPLMERFFAFSKLFGQGFFEEIQFSFNKEVFERNFFREIVLNNEAFLKNIVTALFISSFFTLVVFLASLFGSRK